MAENEQSGKILNLGGFDLAAMQGSRRTTSPVAGPIDPRSLAEIDASKSLHVPRLPMVEHDARIEPSAPSKSRHPHQNFVTVAIGNDDLARVAKLPGTDTTQMDGGQTSDNNIHWQGGRNSKYFAGVNAVVFTSHVKYYPQANQTFIQNERDAYANYSIFGGKSFTKTLTGTSSLFGYVQGTVGYDDTKAIEGIHDSIHQLIGGRSFAQTGEYRRSRVPNGINANLSGMAEIRKDWHIGALDVKPFAYGAAAVGTDRLETAAGVGIMAGYGADGTPQPLATSNPETPGAFYVRDPSQFKKGNWSVAARLTQYGLVDNGNLKGDTYGLPGTNPERFDPRQLALMAAYNIRDNVSLTGSYTLGDNPVTRIPGYQFQGPKNNGTAKLGVTFGF